MSRFTEAAVLSSSDGVSLNMSAAVSAAAPSGKFPKSSVQMSQPPASSLFDTLQATKQEKDAEFALRISRMNAPPGLDDEEADFLNEAIEEQVKTEMIRKLSDAKAVAAFTSAVREIVREAPEPERLSFHDNILTTSANIVPTPSVIAVRKQKPKRKRDDLGTVSDSKYTISPGSIVRKKSPVKRPILAAYESSDDEP
uniref:FAM192A/Fyv6 N-terminal domain-containing protein n=1 Tax=Spongospora subterranea TaxID=70186 RepID=A0A0H5R946_9EUKA|eukprot:CRZ10232.1 hypothetical protein [Spongospora subterranea]